MKKQMDKSIRRLIGISLEFNRLISKENEIPISEYLICNGISFCHPTTYQKMLTGEYANDDLYMELIKEKGICFEYHQDEQLLLKDKYFEIKKDIEFIDEKSLMMHLQEANQMVESLKDKYPHKIECYILKQIESYYINREILDDRTIKILTWILKVASSKSRAILIHLIYFNTHKKRSYISSLKSTFESLPLFDKEDELIALVIARQMIYEKDFEVALNITQKLETICLNTNNLARLSEVYQDMIAIYGGLCDPNKEAVYMDKLKQLLDSNQLNDIASYRSHYYLGMCKFSNHQFEEAHDFLIESLKHNSNSYSVTLFYLSVISYLNKESVITLKDISFDRLNTSQKVFIRYFRYKLAGKSENKLQSYIVEKIIPIINEDYIFEAYIFRQELFLMKEKEAFLLFQNKMNDLNYVILQNWEDVFKSW